MEIEPTMTSKRQFDIPEATLRALYLEQQLSPEAIAEIYGCSDSTVRRELKRKGIPMRSHAEATCLRSIVLCPAPRVVKKQGSIGSGGYPYRQDLWRLAVYRKRALLTLFDLIAPHLKHAKRKRDMNQAVENIRERNERYGNICRSSTGGNIHVQRR